MNYDELRHLADSYGLAAMVVAYLIFTMWIFRPGSRRHVDEAANMIFGDDAERGGKDNG